MAQPTIQRQAQGMLNPVIAAITRAATNRARLAQQAIAGYTNSYAGQLGHINAASPYQAALGQQASVDSALQQSLAGTGTDLASQLAARLQSLQGSSGQGAVDQTGGLLTSRGNANANTELATGSSSLSQLLANQADAGSYSKKLPGLARLSGLQGIKSAQAQASQAIDQGTLSAESQLPTLIRDITAQNATNAYHSAQIQQGNYRLQIEQQRADAYSSHLQQMYSLSYDRYKLDTAKAKAAASGLSPYELATMRAKAASDLRTYFDGVAAKYQLGPNGSRVLVAGTGPPSVKTYQQAITGLMEAYPALGPAQIIGMANGLYRPGEGGRPLGHPRGFVKQYGAWVPPTAGPPGPSGPTTNPNGADSSGAGSATGAGAVIVKMAQEFAGTPYVWGGTSPTKGFDCSGFAQYLYGHAGINIPRTTYTQWTAPNGHAVPKGQLQPGDLVFYKGADSIVENGKLLPGHVGIYIGHGKIMNAYAAGYGVRIDGVFSSAMGGYMGARRYHK